MKDTTSVLKTLSLNMNIGILLRLPIQSNLANIYKSYVKRICKTMTIKQELG